MPESWILGRGSAAPAAFLHNSMAPNPHLGAALKSLPAALKCLGRFVPHGLPGSFENRAGLTLQLLAMVQLSPKQASRKQMGTSKEVK